MSHNLFFLIWFDYFDFACLKAISSNMVESDVGQFNKFNIKIYISAHFMFDKSLSTINLSHTH